MRQNLRKITIPQREPIVAEQVLNEHIDHEVSNDDFEKRTEEPTTAPSIVSIARPRPRPRIRQRRRIRRVKRTARLSRSKSKLVPIQNFAPKNNLSSTPPRSSERWKATTTSTTRRLRFSPAMRRFQSPARRPRPPPMPPPKFRTTRSNLRIGFSTTHRSKSAKLLSSTSTICFYEETIRPSTIYELDGEIYHGVDRIGVERSLRRHPMKRQRITATNNGNE